jgi:hypothetical protein
MGGALTGARSKTITWQTAVQATDRIQVWFSKDQVQWTEAVGSMIGSGNDVVVNQLNSTGGVAAGSGVWVRAGSTSTQSVILFATYMSIANDDSPTVNWPSSQAYWVVTKAAAGQAVGFGSADGTSAGLIPPVTSMSNALATQLGLKQYTTGVTYNNSTQVTFSSTPAGWSLIYAYFVPYQMQDGTWRCRGNVSASWTSTATPGVAINIEALSNGQPAYASAGTTPAYSYGFITRTGSQASNMEWRFGASQTSGTWAADFALNAKPTWAY